MRQPYTQGATEVVLGLPVNLQRRGTAFFGVAVTLITLITQVGIRLGTQTTAAQGVAQFGKSLLAAGVVVGCETGGVVGVPDCCLRK